MTFNSSHQKIDVALKQLDGAIRAYNQGNYIEAITLAGASEEILGALCRRQGLPISVERIASLPVMGGYQNPIAVLNTPRNCLKHANNPNEDIFEIAQEDDFLMIVRAIGNLRELELPQSELVNKFLVLHSPTSSDV